MHIRTKYLLAVIVIVGGFWFQQYAAKNVTLEWLSLLAWTIAASIVVYRALVNVMSTAKWVAGLMSCIALGSTLYALRPDTPTPAPTEVSVRNKYSDEQILQDVIGPGDWNTVLNLDNIAQYTLVVMDSDKPVLMRTASRATITDPKPGERLKPGGGIEAEFQHPPGGRVTNAQGIYDPTGSELIQFAVGVMRELTADGRTFRVTLKAINLKRTSDGRRLVEYVFGISER